MTVMHNLATSGLVRVYLKEGHSGMTTASPHCVTERYLAWELIMAAEDAIPTASDIYATGCIGLEVCHYLDSQDLISTLNLSHPDTVSRETIFTPCDQCLLAYYD
jgi:hypothetical protein